MNPFLENLHLYPFERLNELKKDVVTESDHEHVSLSIGEPKHEPPEILLDSLRQRSRLTNSLTTYPTTRGDVEIRAAISRWLRARHGIDVNHETKILPVNGTREALFSFGQCLLSGKADGVALMPNPFYQIYEGAILLRGTEPYYIPATEQVEFESVPEEIWQRAELIYLCSPGNPSGAVVAEDQLKWLIEKALRHNFVIASDECYSELYYDESQPPAGLLQAAVALGLDDMRNCVMFNSLSKRSNCPGMRSGFVAGDAAILESFFLYRTYHGCAMPQNIQESSALLWADEEHVVANRAAYRAKFDAVQPILSETFGTKVPDGAFYYWPDVGMDDQEFARELFVRENITVLPGTYLGREVDGINPGKNHVRIALVAPLENCVDAVTRLCSTHAELQS